MRPLFFVPVVTLIGLLQLGSSIGSAQSNTLLQCAETLHSTRRAINQSRVSNQLALFPALDPAYQKAKQNYDNWEECVKGHKAPLTSFQTLDGESYEAATLEGKILVINFWGISCAPCIAEMPALNKLVKEYKDKDVLFLGFSGDKAASLTTTFFEKHPFAFKIIADAKILITPFYANSLPTTYIVDQQGIIRKAWIGLEGYTTMDTLAPYYKAKSAIDQLLTVADK